MAYVIGVDVGGTNTDTAILKGTKVVAKAKRPTTKDKTRGIIESIQAALEALPEDHSKNGVLSNLARVSIGTTHFVNAVKERAAEHLKRVAVIRLCGSASRALPPFVDFPKDLTKLVYGGGYMVEGGLEYDAKREISSLNEEELRGTMQQILEQDPPVRNVVISGVFAPCDDPVDNQESRAAVIIKKVCPEISCTLSHELGMLGILERENAAVLNESLKSLANTTIQAFGEALKKLDINCPFYLTQNDGTLISAEEATRYPVLTFSSGPTNSMRGAAFLSGLPNAIVVDIGGTTTDVGVLRDGFPREASSQCKVGGDVRTNFCMPDVLSVALGGGTCVNTDPNSHSVSIGPESVAFRFTEAALCFGGQQCTLTDVAIAAGVAPVDIAKTPEALNSISAATVYLAMREIRRRLESAIDSMKTEREDVPVLLVGGGSILVDRDIPLKGASKVIMPSEHWDVANAVGAALGTVGGSSDHIVNLAEIKGELKAAPGGKLLEASELEKKARGIALERGRENARNEAINKKGAVPETVYIHSEEVSDITYVVDRVRVKVKAIGALTAADVHSVHRSEATETPGGGGAETDDITDMAKIQDEQRAKDNPYWPNSSLEDRAKDEAAHLPAPKVSEDGEWELTAQDVECLAIGAGILGCGGGGDPNEGRLRAQQLLERGKQIKIINPCKVDPTSVGAVCGVAFMGAPVILIEKLCNGEETLLALQRLRQVLASGVCEGEGDGRESRGGVDVEEKTISYPGDPTPFPVWLAKDEDLQKIDVNDPNIPQHRRITSLICCEAGGANSVEPLLAGAASGLPVMDVDGMGRAFPELQMFVPFIYGSRHYPATIADNKGEAMTCTHVGTSSELEKFFRIETVRMGMSSGIAIGVMTFKEMLESYGVLFTMSRAWQLGRAIMRARVQHTNVVQAVIEQQKGMVLMTGKVIQVNRVSTVGFTTVESLIEGLDDFAGYQLKVQAKNENYIAQSFDVSSGKVVEGPVLATTPDLICIIDSDTGDPITTEGIRYGMRVGVVVLPANPMLKTAQALRVVGPKAFGFDMPYKEPHPLKV